MVYFFNQSPSEMPSNVLICGALEHYSVWFGRIEMNNKSKWYGILINKTNGILINKTITTTLWIFPKNTLCILSN